MKKIDDKLLADCYARKEERDKLWREKDLLLKEEPEDEEKAGMKEEQEVLVKQEPEVMEEIRVQDEKAQALLKIDSQIEKDGSKRESCW